MDRRGPALAMTMLLAVLAACGGGETDEPRSSTPSATLSPTPDTAANPFPDTGDPVAVDAGTYLMPRSAWSVADFTVTLPQGWTVQHGHAFQKHPDTEEEFGFYAVVVDEIYADACEGESGEVMEVGPSVDDLASALLEQPGPKASGPDETTLGGYPAIRINLTVPKGFDLKACLLADFEILGLQVWLSESAGKYFVLLRDGIASVYIVDVDGQRQVFVTQHGSATSAKDMRELEAVLDSVEIEA